MRYRQVLGKTDHDRPTLSISQFLKTPPGLIIISFTFFYLAMFQYLRITHYRDPTSYFFDADRAYLPIYSSERRREAKTFIEESAKALPPGKSDVNPVMCIGVATVARRDEQYVRSTVGSLMEGLTPAERESVYLNVLIAHTEPSKHPIHKDPWLKTLPNRVLAYKDTDLKQIRVWENKALYRNKTIFDYTYLLKDCYDTGAAYIAMVEDDVLAARGWLSQSLESLHKVENEMARRPAASWVYMRLFYQELLFGWNSEYWFSYLFWSFVLWAATLSTLLWARSRFRKTLGSVSNLSIGILSNFCLPMMIGLYFLAGRNSVKPLSSGVQEMNKFGCCSQGYIFPREIIPSLLDKTDLETDWLVDMMIEQIADKEGYIRWATVPSLIQHIGSTSSKGWGFDDSAKAIWNFGFELRES